MFLFSRVYDCRQLNAGVKKINHRSFGLGVAWLDGGMDGAVLQRLSTKQKRGVTRSTHCVLTGTAEFRPNALGDRKSLMTVSSPCCPSCR